MARRRVWSGCCFCYGKEGCPRNGAGGATCTSNKCKAKYARQRADPSPAGAADQVADAEELPDGMSVNDVTEILGERCCKLHELSIKKCKNGPGSSYQQQFLVRGSFCREDDSEEEVEDEHPEPGSYWVDQAVLVEGVGVDEVRRVVKERQDRVLDELEE